METPKHFWKSLGRSKSKSVNLNITDVQITKFSLEIYVLKVTFHRSAYCILLDKWFACREIIHFRLNTHKMAQAISPYELFARYLT